MKNILKLIPLIVLFLGAIYFNVLAEEGENKNLVYLPLISNEKSIDPWLGPDGGFVVSMVMHPSNSNIVYAGTYGNGVFKSTDGGLSWKKTSIGLGDLYINSLAIDPQNPSILYAGTYYDEIYKTTDAGKTWFHSSQGVQDEAVVYTIAIDPINPDIIYIGTRGKDAIDPPPWKGVVYRSKNEGINWTPVLSNVGGSKQQDWAYDIVVNPKEHCMVFVAMHEYGVYRSQNCGDNWESVNGNGLIDLSGRALVINPQVTDSDALFYGTWHRTGVYKSTNNGGSWINQYLYAKIYNIDLNPNKPDTIYLADFYDGIIKTTNGGSSWSYIGLDENLLYSVMVNPISSNQVFVGTSGNGIFRSDDGGQNWVHSQKGLNNSMITSIRIHPNQSDKVYASTSRGGFHFSQNAGDDWQNKNTGLSDLDAIGLVLHPQDANQVYLLTSSGGLYTCNLPECSWRQKNVGLPGLDIASTSISEFSPQNDLEWEILSADFETNFDSTKSVSVQALNDLEFSTINPAIVYLATGANGVYKSQDGTDTWSQVGLAGNNIHKIAVHPSNSQIVYASIFNTNIVYTSINGGNSWSKSEVPGGIVNEVTVSQTQPGIVFAATNNGIYQKINDEPWRLLGLNGKEISSLAIHPSQPNLIVAGCYGEVFYTKDGGTNWIVSPSELQSSVIKVVSFDPQKTDRVYLGTNSQGIYLLLIK